MIRKLFATQKRRFLALVLLISVCLTVAFTYPFVLEWPTAVPGEPSGDAYNYAWSNWWFEKALFELGQSPAEMDRIYYPIGAYHPKAIAAIWAKVVNVPLIHFLQADPFFMYNLNLFVANILTLFFMTWLCLELTGSRGAALIGGIIFTFSASRINQVLTGHLTQSMTYFYPLLVLAIVRLWRDPRLLRGLAFGLILGLAVLVDLLPLAFFVGPITLTLLLFLLLSDRRRFLSRAFLGSLLAGLVVTAALVIPFYYPLISAATDGELDWYDGVGVVEFSADALAFIIPTPDHLLTRSWPALQDASERIYFFGLSQLEGTAYLGWLTSILALIGLVRYWETKADIKYWLTVTFASVLLALGPWLRVGGRIITVREQPLIMPYAALLYFPFMSWGRTPGRLGLTAIFAISILAAYGVAFLLGRLTSNRAKIALITGFAGLILLDSLMTFPWPMNDFRMPAFYESIAADQRSVAVLDLPVEGYVPAKYYMLYQMKHGHAIVGGWRDRRSEAVEEQMAEYQALAGPGGDINTIAQAGIGYIVLHKQFMEPGEVELLTAHLDREIGKAMIQNGQFVVYKLANVAEIAPRPIPTS